MLLVVGYISKSLKKIIGISKYGGKKKFSEKLEIHQIENFSLTLDLKVTVILKVKNFVTYTSSGCFRVKR